MFTGLEPEAEVVHKGFGKERCDQGDERELVLGVTEEALSREEEAKFKHTLHRISKKIGTQSKMQQCYTNIEGRSKIKLGTAVGMIMVFQRYPYHNVL